MKQGEKSTLEFFEKNPDKLIEATQKLPATANLGPAVAVKETATFLDGLAKSMEQELTLLDDIFKTQKTVVDQNKNIIAGSNSNAKGAFGEITTDVHLTEKGYRPLHTRKTDLTQGWGETGIDGIFKKGDEYFIVESKYKGTSTLKMTDDGLQMSDTWIRGSLRIERALGDELIAREVINNGYRRILAEVAPDGTIIFKELDAFGKEIGNFIP